MLGEEVVQALLLVVVVVDVLICVKEVEFATREGLQVSLSVSEHLS